MKSEISTPRPPLSQIIIYALGQLGWALASFGAGNLLIYFYMPPEEANLSVFPPYIFQGAILGIATVIGLINFGGRIFDAITDPIIASWSDRKRSKRGKRKSLMALAAIPFALFSVLIFYPITPEVSVLNAVWLVGTIFLFYLFFTMYLIPYNALISELGHHPKDRMLISSVISVTFAIGLILGQQAFTIQSIFAESYNQTEAFQLTVGLFAAVALFFMLIPVFFLKENKYCQQSSVVVDTTQSLKAVFSNTNFRWFAYSDFTYWISLTFIQLGTVYYITALYGMDTTAASLFLPISFLTSFVLYIPINIFVGKLGKKKVLMSAFLVFGLIFLMTGLLQQIPLSPEILFYVLAIASGFPLAAFGIIPNALIADIVYQHEEKTGQHLAGMFYGARTFMMKMGISVANLIFPSLLLLGKSFDNPLGVKVSAFVALGFMLIGFLLFKKYEEKAV